MVQIPEETKDVLRKRVDQLEQELTKMKKYAITSELSRIPNQKEKIFDDYMKRADITASDIRADFPNTYTRKKIYKGMILDGRVEIKSTGGRGKKTHWIKPSIMVEEANNYYHEKIYASNIVVTVEILNKFMMPMKMAKKRYSKPSEGKSRCNLIEAMALHGIPKRESIVIATIIRKYFTNNGEPKRLNKDFTMIY